MSPIHFSKAITSLHNHTTDNYYFIFFHYQAHRHVLLPKQCRRCPKQQPAVNLLGQLFRKPVIHLFGISLILPERLLDGLFKLFAALDTGIIPVWLLG